MEAKPFDPKLKLAMDEIRGVLARHDIAGAITLVSPTHCEYMYKLDPTWSAIRFEKPEKGTVMQLRFKFNKETHEKGALTVHMLCQFSDLGIQTVVAAKELLSAAEKQGLEIDHKSYQGHHPHGAD